MLKEFSSYILECANQNGLSISKHKSGSTLFKEGDEANGVFYIIDRHVRIYKNSASHGNAFMFLAIPGEFIGIYTFFQKSSTHTCTSIVGDKNCQVIFFPNKIFSTLINNTPNLRNELIKILCNRIKLIERRTASIINKNIDSRLLETLVLLKSCNLQTGSNQKETHVNYSIKELSEMIGSSIEYLRRSLKTLKNKDVIDYGQGWLTIKNDQLQKLNARRS